MFLISKQFDNWIVNLFRDLNLYDLNGRNGTQVFAMFEATLI